MGVAMEQLAYILREPMTWVLILVALWFFTSRAAFVLPDPFRLVTRWRRRNALREILLNNPHDRRTRLELGDLLNEARQFEGVREVLRPNLEAGDDDALLAFLWGISSARVGDHEGAERAFDALERIEPSFRLDAVNLERGRARLLAKNYSGAKDALTHFCGERPGTVEGKVLLAQAEEALGNTDAAARLRKDAWSDFAAAPRFRRRQERLWAYRANPARAGLMAAALLVSTAVVLVVAGQVASFFG